jgi:hypothetical protein
MSRRVFGSRLWVSIGPPDKSLFNNFPVKTHKAWTLLHLLRPITRSRKLKERPLPMKPVDSEPNSNSSESPLTLETIISVGVLGWLAIGMVLMGLGIW